MWGMIMRIRKNIMEKGAKIEGRSRRNYGGEGKTRGGEE